MTDGTCRSTRTVKAVLQRLSSALGSAMLPSTSSAGRFSTTRPPSSSPTYSCRATGQRTAQRGKAWTRCQSVALPQRGEGRGGVSTHLVLVVDAYLRRPALLLRLLRRRRREDHAHVGRAHAVQLRELPERELAQHVRAQADEVPADALRHGAEAVGGADLKGSACGRWVWA